MIGEVYEPSNAIAVFCYLSVWLSMLLLVFRCINKSAKSDLVEDVSVRMGKHNFNRTDFPRNLIFEYSKICRKNVSSMAEQRLLYVKTYLHL